MVIGIVAFCQNYGISFENNIPWYISEDLKFFRKMTKNSIVVMGRKTFESIGHPLADRLNIVLTKNPEEYSKNYSVLELENLVFVNYQNVFDIINKYAFQYTNTFVIGGSDIYELFYDKMNTLYVTHVDKKYDTDKSFPKITNDFALVAFSEKYLSMIFQDKVSSIIILYSYIFKYIID